MLKSLVSIIAPCYNKAQMLSRFLDSVIAQTYRPIELIVVNDGSTDNSLEVLNQYADIMKQQSISYSVIDQENGGVSSAINTALEQVRGEFIAWPDVDDWYEKTSIEERVEYLSCHPEVAIVTSDANVFKETDLDHPVATICNGDEHRFDAEQFDLLLLGKSVICPGCHLVRSEALFESLGGRRIYPSRYGQNIQLLLPLYYHHQRGFLDKPLYNYVIYGNSLSHNINGFSHEMKHREERLLIKINTIESIPKMDAQERDRAITIVNVQEAKLRLKLAVKYKDAELAKKQKRVLLEKNAFGKIEKSNYRLAKYAYYRLYKKFVAMLYRCYRKLKLLIK